jgi:hypothetical protein
MAKKKGMNALIKWLRTAGGLAGLFAAPRKEEEVEEEPEESINEKVVRRHREYLDAMKRYKRKKAEWERHQDTPYPGPRPRWRGIY